MSIPSVPANVDLSALGIYNVKYFGAVGDGATDDTVAIQSAINAAYSAGGGIVYLPSATYLINGGPMTPPTLPGGSDGTYLGTTPIPIRAGVPYPLTGLSGYNTGGGSSLPNGPLLLFDDVILMGDGPEQSILLAGEYIYDGYIFSPNGAPESGTVLATANWWADYASDPSDFQDGFFAHKVYVRDLSIDCQGDQCVNVGLPSNVLAGVGEPVPNPAIQRDAQVPPQPIGQLGDAALIIHAAQHCGVENVWVYNGNVNGIDIKGTLNKNAFPNGPLPQSFQQAKAGVPTFVPNATPSSTNVPVMNAYVTRCQVDMNYPKWLAGSPLSTGGSNGQLPIRAIGVAAVVLSFNRIGQRNQPSLFPTAPHGYTNPPDVGPNTNDAMDCPGAWHVLILGNLFTNCGDGVGSDGNGDMIVACNVMYNFGSVGVLSLSKSGKATSQTIIFGNTIFLGSDFASPQQGISIQDTIPPPLPQPGYDLTATPGTVVISNNVIYGSAYNVMIDVTVLGAIVTANILDYAGVEPQGQPVVGEGGTTHWPIPNGAGVRIGGNDIIVEANIFRNAAAAGTKNPSAIGIVFPSGFPPIVAPDSIRVLIKGNIFDKTIGVPLQDNSSGTDGLLGVRVIDNIGINPGETLNPALIPANPPNGSTFVNPYPYDCFVTIIAGATTSVTLIELNGVVTGSTIAANNQKSFPVKAGGSISVTYGGASDPTWTWVGL